jgi:hypothetical protein
MIEYAAFAAVVLDAPEAPGWKSMGAIILTA